MKTARRKIKQCVCMLLTAALLGTMLPQTAVTAYAQNESVQEVVTQETDTVFTEELDSSSISHNEISEYDSVSDNETATEDETISDSEMLAESEEAAEDETVSENEMPAENESISENEVLTEDEEVTEEESVSENEMPAENESISENEVLTEDEEVAEDESVSENEILTENGEVTEEESISENEVSEVTETLSDNTLPDSVSDNELLNDTGLRTVQILADSNALTVSARIGAQAIDYEVTEGGFTYEIAKDETVTVTVTAKDNYAIQSAVTQVEGLADKTERIKATGFVYSVKATADTVTTIVAKALYKGLLSYDGNTIESVKNIYTVAAGVTYEAEVLCGNQIADIKSVAIEQNKSEATKATVTDGGKNVTVVVNSKEAGNTKLKLKVTTVDDSVVAFVISVRPDIQSITVKGVSRGVLKQTVDTQKEYKVSLKPANADASGLYVEAEGDVEAVMSNGILSVTTRTEAKDATGKIHFYNKGVGEEEGTEIESAVITVNAVVPKALQNAKPVVKAAETTDTTLVLNLSVPKTVETPVQGAQYYEIKVIPDASKTVPESIVEAIKEPIYRAKTGLSQRETIDVNTAEEGFGEAWKFTVEVRLVQLPIRKAADAVNTEDVNAQGVFYSRTAILKTAAIKPAYETKLGIKKGATTIYTGQTEIIIGTPNFSKKTSYRAITAVEDITEKLTEEQKLQVEYKNGQIVASAPAGTDVTIGKHTIIAYAAAPTGSKAASATIAVTVVRGIEDISVVADGDSIYKQYNKAATLGVKAVYNTMVASDLPEPKTKKINYTITDVNRNEIASNSPLYGMVTVKSGKVNIHKNYVVSSVPENNMFRVKVTAADYKGTTVCAYSEPIEIKSTTVALGEAVLVACEANQNGEYEVISRGNGALKLEQFNTSRFAVVKAGIAKKDAYTSEDLVDAKELSLTVSNKAITLAADGSVYVRQAVKNVTLTATTKDGSKGKVTLTKLTLDYTTPLALGVNISRATYRYMSDTPEFYTIGSPDSTTVSYQAANNEIFKLEVMKQDATGNWIKISSEEYMNYTLALVGAKQLSRDKDTYLITATAATTKITITDKANQNAKTEYTLINEAGVGNALASLKVTTKDMLVAGPYESEQSVTFEVVAGGDYNYYDANEIAKYAEIRVDAVSAQKNKAQYESLLNATTGIDGYHTLNIDTTEEYNDEGELISSDTIYSFTVYFDKKSYTNITAGTYKFNVTLGELIGGDFIADTKTTSVTLKVVEHKKLNISFKPTVTYAISPKDNQAIVLNGTLNDEWASYEYTEVHNVISNGEVNHFKDYFDFEPTQNGVSAKLKLKAGIDAEHLMSNEGKVDCSAFADYKVYDENGVLYKKDTIKITVKVQEDPVTAFTMKLLPVMKKESGTEMKTTLTVTRSGKAVNIPYVYVAVGNFEAKADGTSVIKLTTTSLPSIGTTERVEMYFLPDTSCYAQQLAEYVAAGDTDAYNALLQTHGIKYIGNIQFKEDSSLRQKLTVRTAVSYRKEYFSREDAVTGMYHIPLTYTKNAAVDVADVSVASVNSENSMVYEEWPEEYQFVTAELGTDSRGADAICIILDKAKFIAAKEASYFSNTYVSIKLSIAFENDLTPQEVNVRLSYPRWQTFSDAKQYMDKLALNYITAGWKGSREKTLEYVEQYISKRFSSAVKYDSHAMLTYDIDESSIVEPTRMTKGQVNVDVSLVDTMSNDATPIDYSVVVKLQTLGAWPEDIAEELNEYLAGYQTEENPHVFNHTIAEDIADDIRSQAFIVNHEQFKVDVTNLTKIKATELEDGSCSVKIRIIDTTGRGAAYEKYCTWPIYQLDTLAETAEQITEVMAVAEATNRTEKEMVEAWIDSTIYNKDIIWSWKDDYKKTLATHESYGSIAGTIVMQNPKSVIDPTAKYDVAIHVRLEKMTDPADIYMMLDGVVGINALYVEMFCETHETPEGDIYFTWLTEQEMSEMILSEANAVLKDANEMYYAEYDKDEDGKDKFKYSPVTYKTAGKVSYTLVMKNEFTDEVVGEALVVENFILEDAKGDLQTLTDWKSDILALIEEGNASGRFTNDMSEWDVTALAQEVCTNMNFSVDLKYTDEDSMISDFVMQEATLDETGWITMSLVLSEDMENVRSLTFSVKLLIPTISQTMDEAEMAANAAITGLVAENLVSNDMTADDILSVVKAVLKKSKYQVSWSESAPYTMSKATQEGAGSITGELIIYNLNPAEEEAESVIVPVDFTIAELKTAEEAENAVREAVTGDAVLVLAGRGDADTVKSKILAVANEVIKYDGYVVTYKKSGTKDMFDYLASTYKSAGYVSYTLLLSPTAGNTGETVEIVVEDTELPLDLTKQTVSLLNSDIRAKFAEMTNEGAISNDITAEDLLVAAKEVLVNPELELYLWTEEEFGRYGSIKYVIGGSEMQVVREATTTRTGTLTISFVIRSQSASGSEIYKAYKQTVTIPKITE